jgi:hypothetical protein
VTGVDRVRAAAADLQAALTGLSTIGPAAAGHDTRCVDLLRDEVKILKDEQRDRIRHRDSLVYSVIVAAAAVAGGTRLAGDGVPLLLPPITLALGWTYLVNDQKISAIGAYLRTELGPRLGALVGADVLGWETTHRTDRRRRQRKLLQLGVDLLVFVAPAAAALGRFWTSTATGSGALLAVSVAEALAVLVAAWQVITYAEITTGGPAVPQGGQS